MNINMRSKVEALLGGPRARDPGTLPGAVARAPSKATPSDCKGVVQVVRLLGGGATE